MSGGLLKALRSDSYVELSQYRDQHFRVREAGSRPRARTLSLGLLLSHCVVAHSLVSRNAKGSLGACWGMDAERAFGYHQIPFSRRKGV